LQPRFIRAEHIECSSLRSERRAASQELSVSGSIVARQLQHHLPIGDISQIARRLGKPLICVGSSVSGPESRSCIYLLARRTDAPVGGINDWKSSQYMTKSTARDQRPHALCSKVFANIAAPDQGLRVAI
jgi:hypothetical protein